MGWPPKWHPWTSDGSVTLSLVYNQVRLSLETHWRQNGAPSFGHLYLPSKGGCNRLRVASLIEFPFGFMFAIRNKGGDGVLLGGVVRVARLTRLLVKNEGDLKESPP